MIVYFGTYTEKLHHVDGKAQGIVTANFNTETGELKVIENTCEIRNPSFLCFSKDRRFLYSIGEIKDFSNTEEGSLSVFRVEPGTGKLEQLQQHSSAGVGPAYISLDRTGKYLLNANYLAGNIAAFPIKDDGTMMEAASVIRHQGSSINPKRQQAPHPHCIIASPDNKYVYVPDLGIDQIVGYGFDAETGALSFSEQATTSVVPGSGPRHLTFHPSAKFAFLIHELSSTMTSYRYDAGTGSLTEIQTISTLPEDFPGESYCAEVRVSKCGRFLYGSNRGHDSIAAFRIDDSGGLELLGFCPTKGAFPRNFAFTPDGRFILAANQNSSSAFTFKVDPESGTLSETGFSAAVPTPVYVLFHP